MTPSGGILGLDIGGANLKAAHSGGGARCASFPLWRDPSGLERALADLLQQFPAFARVALTMTGELCDCFASQAEGVRFILEAARRAAGDVETRVWGFGEAREGGVFLSWDEAASSPARVAAANWLAQATFAGRLAPGAAALLIDMGSTTTDIVPLWEGRPVPGAKADPDRLAKRELVYTGASRTPVCAVLGEEVAAEFFATMADVYQVLGEREPAGDESTADGRGVGIDNAHARLARMLCGDPATMPRERTMELARAARDRQEGMLREAVAAVGRSLPEKPTAVLISGSGAFVLRRLLRGLMAEGSRKCIDLVEEWGEDLAGCGCAWAVAQLLSVAENDGGR